MDKPIVWCVKVELTAPIRHYHDMDSVSVVGHHRIEHEWNIIAPNEKLASEFVLGPLKWRGTDPTLCSVKKIATIDGIVEAKWH